MQLGTNVYRVADFVQLNIPMSKIPTCLQGSIGKNGEKHLLCGSLHIGAREEKSVLRD